MKRTNTDPVIGEPNDRWPKRLFRNGFERMGIYFPDTIYPSSSLTEFLRDVDHMESRPFPPEFPDRPLITGHQRDLLDARLRSLWDALGEENRLPVMNRILAKIQPIWRARAILFLPLTPEERDSLRGRWCRDTDRRFPSPKGDNFRVPYKYEEVDRMMGRHHVKGQYVRSNWK